MLPGMTLATSTVPLVPERPLRLPLDMRSVKSLDCNSDNESASRNNSKARANLHQAMTVEGRSLRPTPPKKPLRLSLQRAQSLQTVELTAISENERKRATKRAHITERRLHGAREDAAALSVCNNVSGESQTSTAPTSTAATLHISSLGRQQRHLI